MLNNEEASTPEGKSQARCILGNMVMRLRFTSKISTFLRVQDRAEPPRVIRKSEF